MQPYPPLGTLYAAGFLRGRGYDVALFDAMLAESEDEWAQALDRERPRFAVLYEDNFNYLSKMCLLRMRTAALTMIEMARARGCTVIICGADASDHADLYLGQGAHFVLIGEGEHTLGELMDRLTGRSDMPFEEILGLAWVDDRGPLEERSRGGEGEKRRRGEEEIHVIPLSPSPTLPLSLSAVRRNARRPDIKDVDALPFPAWDLVDIPRYREIWHQRHGYYSMNMVTTRGCPYHCNWCAKPIWGQRYNARSPQNVVAELKWLKQTYQPDHIWFADDIMGLKPKWLEQFADLVEQQDARIPFKSLHRVDILSRSGTVEALSRAGAKTIWVGAESGSQQILDAMDKGTRVEHIYEAARRMRAAGIEVGFFLQFGYPGETRVDIEKTLQMVRDCRPDDIGMSVSYPLPGTKFHERVVGELGVKQNWQDSNDMAMLYQGPYTTEFYRQLHTVLHKEFRARKYWAELKYLARHPQEWRKHHLRRAAVMVYHTLGLPLERYRLNRLQQRSHGGMGPLPPGMRPEAAATPSPQAET